MFFKEIQESGRFHIHCFLWIKDHDKKLKLDVFTLHKLWGASKQAPDLKKLHTDKDLVNLAFYCTNYNNENNEKVERLKNFPSGAYLYNMSKDLEIPPKRRIDELDKKYKEYLHSEAFGNEFDLYINQIA